MGAGIAASVVAVNAVKNWWWGTEVDKTEADGFEGRGGCGEGCGLGESNHTVWVIRITNIPLGTPCTKQNLGIGMWKSGYVRCESRMKMMV